MEKTVELRDKRQEKPVVDFSAVGVSGKVFLKVKFTEESTESRTAWKWDFGNETTSTEQSPVHIYK